MRSNGTDGTIVSIGFVAAYTGMPFGRLVDPDEVARALAFLASDESGLMTGSVVNFDQSVWAASDAMVVPEHQLPD